MSSVEPVLAATRAATKSMNSSSIGIIVITARSTNGAAISSTT